MFCFKTLKIFPIFIFAILFFLLLFFIQLMLLEFDDLDYTLVWWTPFLSGERNIQCGNICCFVTDNRNGPNQENTAFLFYGTHFNANDLPLPRANNIWGIMHEESPRNSPLLNHEPILSLFNYSSTFSRFSNIPLTLQYLPSLESLTSKQFYKTFEYKSLSNHSEVVYIQSDCVTPNNRDSYVQELMKYINIDSYGACLNNKKLPLSLSNALDTMMSSELLQLIGNYKFTVAFENAVCEDYITEKLWRPLIAGSVPLYFGSPSVKDWIPNTNSVVFPSDFSSPKELANYLHHLSSQPEAYNHYLKHKIEQKIENKFLIKNFFNYEESLKWNRYINEFECLICEKLVYNKTGYVNKNHYNCPEPVSILNKKINMSNWWHNDYLKSKCEALVLRKYIDNSLPFNTQMLQNVSMSYLTKNTCKITV